MERGPQRDATIEIGQASHPHLADHAIDGNPVVPVVYAIEWLARSALEARPGLHIAEIADLKVLNGIVLRDFFDGAVTSLSLSSEIEAESASDVSLVLRLADRLSGRPHYSCRVHMTSEPPVPPTVEPPVVDHSDQNGAAHYGGVLFHGAAFQVLNTVVGLGQDGCSGVDRRRRRKAMA